MILHSDRKGNDCIRKLRCHCIQILHSDIYSVQTPSFSYKLVSKNLQHCLISTLLSFFYGNFFTVLYFSPLGRSIIGQQSKQLPEVFHWIPTILQLVKQVTYVLCTYFQAAFSIFSNSPMIKIPKECQKQDLTVTPSKRALASPPTQHNGTRTAMNPKLYFKFQSYFRWRHYFV